MEPLALLVLYLLAVGVSGVPPGARPAPSPPPGTFGLFHQSDPVEILHGNGFWRKFGSSSSSAWLVLFYNTWCGHCQRFAPTYKALGQSVAAWRDVVRLGAVDCAEDINNKICRDFEIMAYPTMRYFGLQVARDGSAPGEKLDAGSMAEMRSRLAAALRKDFEAGKGGQTWPRLSDIAEGSLELVERLRRPADKAVLLVMANAGDTACPEAALDLHKIHNVLVLCSSADNAGLFEALDRPALPHLRNLLQPSDQLSRDNDLVLYARRSGATIPDELSKPPELNLGLTEALDERIADDLREQIKRYHDAVFIVDLEKAFRDSVTKGLRFSAGRLSGEPLAALRNYLQVVHRHLPLKPAAVGLVDRLRKALNDTEEVESAQLEPFLRQVEAEGNDMFHGPLLWMACAGSDPNHRGFPCGMWKMFHYLTVAAYRAKSPASEVLPAVHGYVKHFFGCTDCSEHFKKMAQEDGLFSVANSRAAVLWLWRAHNKVNLRLSTDTTSLDPEYPKIQYPSASVCPKCRRGDEFDEEQVLTYLEQVYGEDSIVYVDSSLHSLLYASSAASHVSPMGGTIFSRIDMSLIFVLYFVSFCSLVLIVHWFSRRRFCYKKKLYVHDALGKI